MRSLDVSVETNTSWYVDQHIHWINLPQSSIEVLYTGVFIGYMPFQRTRHSAFLSSQCQDY